MAMIHRKPKATRQITMKTSFDFFHDWHVNNVAHFSRVEIFPCWTRKLHTRSKCRLENNDYSIQKWYDTHNSLQATVSKLQRSMMVWESSIGVLVASINQWSTASLLQRWCSECKNGLVMKQQKTLD